MKKIECFFDGCCEPKNPGGAMGIGAVVLIDGNVCHEFSEYYPAKEGNTNNIAEYIGLSNILNFLLEKELDSEDISIMGDSQLAIKQMKGEYSIKSGGYVPYAKNCLALLSGFKNFPSLIWIPREKNELADKLSKAHLEKNNIQVRTHSDDGESLGFGKYSGKPIKSITDLNYLKWAINNIQKLKPKIRETIRQRIHWLEFENK